MIHQIAPVAQKTTSLSGINKALLQARHIQAKIKKEATQSDDKPEVGIVWTPMALPYLVPITRWIE
jgi:hypothetical protein